MPLSEVALMHDSKQNCLPMREIFPDPEFNCRGHIVASDIMELVKDVSEKGLLQQVVVRQLWDNEQELKDKGYKYYLVSGFRRFTAYKVLNAEKIPAHVRTINSDFEAKDLNAIENLQRQDLTLYQEAVSIRHYWLAGWTRDEIARRVNKSSGWVQVRIMLLEMQPEIQQAAHQGYLLQQDIRTLHSFNGTDRLKRAGIMRDARKRGQKGVTVKLKKKDKANTTRVRTKNEISEMNELIREHLRKVDRDQMIPLELLISESGNLYPMFRLIAWMQGEITSEDFHVSLQEFFKVLNYEYELPDFEPEHVY